MKSVVLCAALLTCAGCAPVNYRPVVDDGAVRGYYEGDLADCQRLAAQRPAAARAAAGATVGALLGTVFGLAVGLRGRDVAHVAHVAAWGATTGGIGEGVEGSLEQRAIVGRCMEGRGYRIIAD